MARQTGMYMVGRRAHIIYYKWKQGYYLRTKSSLTGERVRKDPAFARSRVRAREFGVASRLATEVFHLLPKEARKRGVIGSLTGAAHTGLMKGQRPAIVREVLLEWVEQLLPKAVLRKYRRQISGEKSPGITRQQQWISESKTGSAWQVNADDTLQQYQIPEGMGLQATQNDTNGASPPDG